MQLWVLFCFVLFGGEREKKDKSALEELQKYLLNIYLLLILELLFEVGEWLQNGPKLNIAYIVSDWNQKNRT